VTAALLRLRLHLQATLLRLLLPQLRAVLPGPRTRRWEVPRASHPSRSRRGGELLPQGNSVRGPARGAPPARGFLAAGGPPQRDAECDPRRAAGRFYLTGLDALGLP